MQKKGTPITKKYPKNLFVSLSNLVKIEKFSFFLIPILIENITFARGGNHLIIANALHLPETEIISWAGDFFGGRVCFGAGEFWGAGRKVSAWKKKERKNNAKFSGHYVCPRTHKVRLHALRSHQLFGGGFL